MGVPPPPPRGGKPVTWAHSKYGLVSAVSFSRHRQNRCLWEVAGSNLAETKMFLRSSTIETYLNLSHPCRNVSYEDITVI